MSGTNEKCIEARELFSPFLDGEASPKEQNLLTGHLLHCEECQQEFELWKKISETLAVEAFEEEPSADFTARVVNRLNSERKIRAFPVIRLPRTWRAPAAAAAAAVILFAGSWGVGVALKNPDPGQKPAIVAQNGGQTGAPTGTVDNNTPDPEVKTNAPTNNGSTPSEQPSTGDVGKQSTGKDTTATGHTGQTGSPPGNTVLLSSNKSTASTILKISTNNPANSKDLALGMVSGLGGSGQVLSNQKNENGGDLIIISMSVSRSGGPTLVSQLSGLGGILERSENKTDITAQYNTAQNRLADIQATIASGTDTDEKSQLDSEASVLKRQIEKWDKESASYTVILWLEQ